ncbi:MAG: 2-oxoglutarate dehydrogenase complex dihydrolipoyllysine-residue succinyltransferase [Burkholderiaceae bacterium]|jgi:2-oxoglutarate dehydrogenase E2 component (dihydrolipoamide succinyltransferase)
MALVEVKVPQLSESVAEATLLQWKKKAGDAVARDEILVEIETDKVVLEVPAPDAGVLSEITRPDGSTVMSDEKIAVIDNAASAGGAVTAAVAPPPVAQPVQAPAPSAAATGTSSAAAGIAMPAAAKLLADHNLAAAQVSGTGRDGRITKADVLNAAAAPAAAPPAARPAAPPAPAAPRPTLAEVKAPIVPDAALQGRTEQRVPMSRLRQRIAERLLQSQSNAAILTTFNEVNMQPVMDLRNRYKDRFEKEHGVKLGFMSFFVKAAVYALKKYPVINASVDGTDIVYHGYFDVGIAVSSPRGLVVPILRNADQMTFADVERTIAEYAAKARDGKLSIEDLTGGTFSISNGGTFGSMLSTPIINPPQSAILGIHATKDRAVVEDGQVVVRPMNFLAMSYDHRIIDGREAVLALVAIKDALEDPARLLLEL